MSADAAAASGWGRSVWRSPAAIQGWVAPAFAGTGGAAEGAGPMATQCAG